MPFHKTLPGFKALSRALMHKDDETQKHSSRVMFLAEELGKACNLTNEELSTLKISACLHDIGKIGIPDAVLFKPTKFDELDWDIMRTHPDKGDDIIRSLKLVQCEIIAEAVRHHHENFDGKGYPDKLSGEEIPYFARIVSIADSYDAMTATRPYQKKRSHTETLDVLFSEEGNKSDPYLFRKFVGFVDHSEYRVR